VTGVFAGVFLASAGHLINGGKKLEKEDESND
jgi:hypothetical protein